jgi:hypothetical protein
MQGPQQVSGDESDPNNIDQVSSADGVTHALWYEDSGPEIFQSSWDMVDWSRFARTVCTPCLRPTLPNT